MRTVRPERPEGAAPVNDGGPQIAVNCRSRSAPGTGVQRYVAELLAQLEGRVEPLSPSRPRRGLCGHAWEQVVLPGRVRGLLWSPANTGPLAVRRQVVTVHDVATFDHPEWFRPAFARWYRFFTPRLLRRALWVITVSEFSKDRIVACTGVAPEKVEVIPNGVGAWLRPPGEDESERLLARRPGLRCGYVLFLGSLEPRKNLRRLFAAWERVGPRFPGVTLAVAGASGRVFAGAGCGEAPKGVTLLGRTDDDELRVLYGNALAFIYPSLYEGFGLPPLEAMACGAPVVVSRVSSMPELVGGDAVLVEPADIESIADGLGRVLSDGRLRDDLRRRGPERAHRFTWEASAERTWRVLRDAAGDP